MTNILLSLFSTCMLASYSQEEPVIGMILTKEEMKEEINSQIAEALTMERIGHSTGTNIDNIIEKLDEINKKLEAICLRQTGITACHPATSCVEIFDYNPKTPSGYYWLKDSDGSAVRVYCDMTLTCKGVGGGWMQVAKLDMTDSSEQCPPGTRLRTDLPKRLCGINFDGPGCSSTTFDVHGIEYRQVCGKIIAYQDASPDAFSPLGNRNNDLDGNYVDGISLTHGSKPRHHIWTFAAALDEVGGREERNKCPCTNIHDAASATPPPSFVGNDYFCDTASAHRWSFIFYPDDPLWDGAGCGSANTCCSLNNPPWFLKKLPFTTADDIEMRMCRDHPPRNNRNNLRRVDEDTPIEILEIYVR